MPDRKFYNLTPSKNDTQPKMTSNLKHIASIEDERDIQIILELALRQLGGFEVDLYEDGPSALLAMEDDKPDLIILDMMMPGMDGIETFGIIKKSEVLANTPVIFMTAKAQPSEIKSYLEIGAIGVITKPFDPVTLADDVREIWTLYQSKRAQAQQKTS